VSLFGAIARLNCRSSLGSKGEILSAVRITTFPNLTIGLVIINNLILIDFTLGNQLRRKAGVIVNNPRQYFFGSSRFTRTIGSTDYIKIGHKLLLEKTKERSQLRNKA